MPGKWKNPNQGLFNGYWFDLSGKKLGKAHRSEIGEAYRLRRVHKDILEGRHPLVHQGLKPLGQKSSLHA